MPQLLKSKEEALQACAEQHHALVTCFKTCSFASSFKGCCTAEHKVFWECYTRERGTNLTKVTSWLDGLFSGEGFTRLSGSAGAAAAPASQQPQQQQQQQQAAQQQQQQQEDALLEPSPSSSSRPSSKGGGGGGGGEAAMEVDLGWLAGVVARHCPTFFLHPDDRFMPCSAEFFLQHCELRQRDAAGAEAVLLPRCSVAGPLLLEAQARAPPGSRLWLELHPDARPGAPKDQLAEVPVYVHPKAVVRADGSVEALEITYITIYAYNGPYRVGGMPFLQTGAHDGDIEHCTARVDHATGELLSFWYNAHRSRDGCWAAAAGCRAGRDGSIAAYVAKHGHGVYPSPGRVYRHFLLGNDLVQQQRPGVAAAASGAATAAGA